MTESYRTEPGPTIPRKVAVRAVEWHLDLQTGDASESALQHWLQQAPEHRRAWNHIQNTNQRLYSLSDPAARNALLSASGRERRKAVKTLAMLLFVGSSGVLSYQHAPWHEALADIRTGTGERRQLTLADGSQLNLNSDTAVNIQALSAAPGATAQSGGEIRIHLLKGEILLTTAASLGQTATAPPPHILTRQGELQPLGTRFAVRQLDTQSQVDVFEGAVAVYPGHRENRAGIIPAGQRSRFDQQQLGPQQPTDDTQAAWVDGMLIAARMPLGDFLQQLSRHRPGYLGCNPSIAALPVSGSYPLDDTDRVLDALTRTLPVKLHHLTRYWVRVTARGRGLSVGPAPSEKF